MDSRTVLAPQNRSEDMKIHFFFERNPLKISRKMSFLKRLIRSNPLLRRLQNRIFENLKITFRVLIFGRLKCIKMQSKWALNCISTLETLKNG